MAVLSSTARSKQPAYPHLTGLNDTPAFVMNRLISAAPLALPLNSFVGVRNSGDTLPPTAVGEHVTELKTAVDELPSLDGLPPTVCTPRPLGGVVSVLECSACGSLGSEGRGGTISTMIPRGGVPIISCEVWCERYACSAGRHVSHRMADAATQCRTLTCSAVGSRLPV